MSRFTISAAPQRSIAWHQARVGRLTGTSAKAMLAGATTDTRRGLIDRLLAERITGVPQDSFQGNEATEWGVAHEDEARIAYEWHAGAVVQECGFLALADLMAGASVDGYIGDFAGIVELKAPFKTERHLAARRRIPPDYLPQVRHNLWVSGAAYCDYVSFDPRCDGPWRLFVHRVTRAQADVAGYEQKALAFLADVETEIAAHHTTTNISGTLAAVLIEAAS